MWRGSHEGEAPERQDVGLFETLNVYLGSLYVNDFNKFGRTYQVLAQADAPFVLTSKTSCR